MSPDGKARAVIDKKLAAAGWVLQDYKGEFNPAASLGVAVREFPVDSGHVDYLLFVDRQSVGLVEAKRFEEGQNLTVTERQTLGYAKGSLKYTGTGHKIRFA
jgi:type I restriction enzyme R subunit